MSDDPRLGMHPLQECYSHTDTDERHMVVARHTGSIIKSGEPQRDEDVASVVLIGFPHDEGVRRNGGRVGARHGPSTVRVCHICMDAMVLSQSIHSSLSMHCTAFAFCTWA